jgi:hypothetical protein
MQTDSGAQIEAIRRFNRFYTRKIGVLEEGLLASSFTLAQARVLFELGTRKRATPGKLIEILALRRFAAHDTRAVERRWPAHRARAYCKRA